MLSDPDFPPPVSYSVIPPKERLFSPSWMSRNAVSLAPSLPVLLLLPRFFFVNFLLQVNFPPKDSFPQSIAAESDFFFYPFRVIVTTAERCLSFSFFHPSNSASFSYKRECTYFFRPSFLLLSGTTWRVKKPTSLFFPPISTLILRSFPFSTLPSLSGKYKGKAASPPFQCK